MGFTQIGGGMWTWRFVLCLGLGLALSCSDKDNENATDSGGTLVEGDEAGECSDEADNDGNGLFDCDDPGCVGSPACDDGNDLDADGGSTDDGSGTTDAGGTTNGDGGGSGGTATTGGGSTGGDTTSGSGGETGSETGASDDGAESTPCSGPEDCSADDCPAGSASCICSEAEAGEGFCVPGCETDDDCAGDDAVCLPSGPCGASDGADGGAVDGGTADGGGDPGECTVDADCAASCPIDESCVCMEPAGGGAGFCVSACTADSDCPDGLSCDLASGRCGGGGGPGGGAAAGGDPGGGGLPPLERCESTDECDPGKVCLDGEGGGLCMTTCTSDAECTDEREPSCEETPDGAYRVCVPTGGGGTGGEMGGEMGGGGPGGGGEGPSRCATDSDCGVTDCPEGSVDCVCRDFGGGASCVPACSTGDECPTDLPFCEGGVCSDTEEPVVSETSCSGDTDCTMDDCPMWSVTCVCHPAGRVCVPGCTSASECPGDTCDMSTGTCPPPSE